jgi:hypothetical protein
MKRGQVLLKSLAVLSSLSLLGAYVWFRTALVPVEARPPADERVVFSGTKSSIAFTGSTAPTSDATSNPQSSGPTLAPPVVLPGSKSVPILVRVPAPTEGRRIVIQEEEEALIGDPVITQRPPAKPEQTRTLLPGSKAPVWMFTLASGYPLPSPPPEPPSVSREWRWQNWLFVPQRSSSEPAMQVPAQQAQP